MYEWRQMTNDQRKAVLDLRTKHKRPWHYPPKFEEQMWFHVTSACYEHRPVIGWSPERMSTFSDQILKLFLKPLAEVMAWVVLPNHYHVLVRVFALPQLRKQVGYLHGRNSHHWNVEEGCQGRHCFHGSLFKEIKSEAHRWSTLNYIHHNPVKHGYVEKWGDWAFGSAQSYLASTPKDLVKMQWRSFPIIGMGQGWDEEK